MNLRTHNDMNLSKPELIQQYNRCLETVARLAKDRTRLIDALKEAKVALGIMSEKEHELRACLVDFVRVENMFGHTGQHKPEECADCKRVIASNKALGHGYLEQLPPDALSTINQALEGVK